MKLSIETAANEYRDFLAAEEQERRWLEDWESADLANLIDQVSPEDAERSGE